MKKLLTFVVLLMMLIAPTNAQSTDLLVHDGDEFTFVLKTFNSDDPAFGAGYMIAGEVSDGSATAVVTLNEGDSFTLRIVSATPVKEYGESYIATEYISHGITMQVHEHLELGGFVVAPDWDTYRAEYSANSEYSESTDDFQLSSNVELVDTSTEFGIISTSKVTFVYGEDSMKSTGRVELRYSKTDGVANYLFFSSSSSGTISGSSTANSLKMVIQRQGYSLPDDGPSLALPANQIFLIIPAMIAIAVIRRRIYT